MLPPAPHPTVLLPISPWDGGRGARSKQAGVRQQRAREHRPHQGAFSTHVRRRQQEQPSEVERVGHRVPTRYPVRHQVFHLVSAVVPAFDAFDAFDAREGGEGEVGGYRGILMTTHPNNAGNDLYAGCSPAQRQRFTRMIYQPRMQSLPLRCYS